MTQAQFRERFSKRLESGSIETVTRVTHPFVLGDGGAPDHCDRCGDPLDNETSIFRLVAYLEENGQHGTVRPVILGECVTCVGIEDRFHDAEFVAATA